jgi:hypothetical protein
MSVALEVCADGRMTGLLLPAYLTLISYSVDHKNAWLWRSLQVSL